MSHCYDQVDYISMHQYYGIRDGNSQDLLASSDSMNRIIRQVASNADAVKARKRSPKTINISFDEWNVWYHSNADDQKIEPWCSHPHQLEDIYNFEDSLLVASMMITMLRNADRVKIACLAQLVNVIAPIMTSDTGAWKQTIYYPFELISNYGRGHVLNTLVDAPTFESTHGDSSYLDAVVVENEEQDVLTIFAVNKNLQEDLELSCDLRQYQDYRLVEDIVLHHTDLKAVNTESAPDTVAPSIGNKIKFEGGVLQGVLGWQSFHVIRLAKNYS